MADRVQLRFDPEREEAELREYLGDAYDRDLLMGNAQLLEEEVVVIDDEQRFYRASRAYLYNLTAFAMTTTKRPYLELLTRCVPPGSRILDYGCGIGSDGLTLIDAGYQVEFADFDNPSTEYLRWRLERRNLEAPVHDLDGTVPGGFDAAFAFDVAEHVEDSSAFMGELESRAALVAVNLLEFAPNEQRLHYRLPVGTLLRRATKGRIERYRVLHGSSHLIIYRPQSSGMGRRAVNLGRLGVGRARALLA
jgi:SAM-dependent methyltransferase